MDSLPVELLIEIFEWIPKTRQGLGFRAAGKKYAAALTPLVFREIHLSFLPQSFRNLLNISRDSKLNQHVQRICYFGDFHCPMNRETWEQYLRLPETIHDPVNIDLLNISSLYTTEELNVGWQRFNMLLKDVKTLDKIRIDHSFLAASLPRFPKLQAVCLFLSGYRYFVNNCNKNAVFSSALVDLDRWSWSEQAAEASDLGLFYGLRQLQSIFGALALTSVKLESLELHGLIWDDLNDKIPANIELLSLENLQTLSLSISHRYGWDYDGWIGNKRSSARHMELGKIVSQAKNLHRLALSFGTLELDGLMVGSSCPYVVLSRIIGCTVWSHLAYLEIREVIIAPASFIDILSRHSKTLKFLRIADLWISGNAQDSWIQLFTQISELGILETVKARGTFSIGEPSRGPERPVYTYWFLDTAEPYSKFSDTIPLRDALDQWFSGQGKSPFEDKTALVEEEVVAEEQVKALRSGI